MTIKDYSRLFVIRSSSKTSKITRCLLGRLGRGGSLGRRGIGLLGRGLLGRRRSDLNQLVDSEVVGGDACQGKSARTWLRHKPGKGSEP